MFLKEHEVQTYIKQTKSKPSKPPGDIIAIIVKIFLNNVSKPLTHILNICLKHGEWPNIWKVEAITLVPKVIPPKKIGQLKAN